MRHLDTYDATESLIPSRSDDLYRRAQASVFKAYLVYVISAVVPVGAWFYGQETEITTTMGGCVFSTYSP